MASTQIFHANSVSIAAAPPVALYPNSNGSVAHASTLGYVLTTDSTGFSGSPVVAQFGIEVETSPGVWTQFASGGQGIGQANWNDSSTPTFVCQSTFVLDNPIPAHSHVRIRMDSAPACTLGVTIAALT